MVQTNFLGFLAPPPEIREEATTRLVMVINTAKQRGDQIDTATDVEWRSFPVDTIQPNYITVDEGGDTGPQEQIYNGWFLVQNVVPGFPIARNIISARPPVDPEEELPEETPLDDPDVIELDFDQAAPLAARGIRVVDIFIARSTRLLSEEDYDYSDPIARNVDVLLFEDGGSADEDAETPIGFEGAGQDSELTFYARFRNRAEYERVRIADRLEGIVLVPAYDYAAPPESSRVCFGERCFDIPESTRDRDTGTDDDGFDDGTDGAFDQLADDGFDDDGFDDAATDGDIDDSAGLETPDTGADNLPEPAPGRN